MARGRRPPGLTLKVVDRAVEGELGSHVWRGRAVDSLIAAPAESVSVVPGASLRFGGPGGVPEEASISLYRREHVDHPELRPVHLEQLDPDELTWIANVEPGDYVLGLFRAWRGLGDSIHYFSISVSAAGAE